MSLSEQARFVVGFYRERAVIRYGAHLRRDPLCRLHLGSRVGGTRTRSTTRCAAAVH